MPRTQKLTAEEDEAAYKQLVFEDSLVIESQAATIRVSELTKDQSAIELQRAEGNVKRMEIRSPMDGIAVMASIVRNGEYGQVREGDQVNAGQPFLTIVDPSSMILDASVNQVDAEKLRLGMKAMVHLDAYPDIDLPGVLEGIGAMSETSTFRAGYVGEIPVRIEDRQDGPAGDSGSDRKRRRGSERGDRTPWSCRGRRCLKRTAVRSFTCRARRVDQETSRAGVNSYTQVAIHSGLQKRGRGGAAAAPLGLHKGALR